MRRGTSSSSDEGNSVGLSIDLVLDQPFVGTLT
jgi:hypothetical protein